MFGARSGKASSSDIFQEEKTMPVSGTNNNRTPLGLIQNESQKPVGQQDGKGVLHVKGNGLQVRTPDNVEISSRP